MKTPKRKFNEEDATNLSFDNMSVRATKETRWKRKNRVAQLKRTIKRLTMGEHLLPVVQTAYLAMRSLYAPGKGLKDKLKYIQRLTLLAKHFSMLAVNAQDDLLNELRRQELGGGDTEVSRSEEGEKGE